MKISVISKRNYPEIEALKRSFKLSKSPDIGVAVGGDGTFIAQRSRGMRRSLP